MSYIMYYKLKIMVSLMFQMQLESLMRIIHNFLDLGI